MSSRLPRPVVERDQQDGLRGERTVRASGNRCLIPTVTNVERQRLYSCGYITQIVQASSSSFFTLFHFNHSDHRRSVPSTRSLTQYIPPIFVQFEVLDKATKAADIRRDFCPIRPRARSAEQIRPGGLHDLAMQSHANTWIVHRNAGTCTCQFDVCTID